MKNRLKSIIRNAFDLKNSNRRYKYLVLEHDETYFVKGHSDAKNKYSEDDIIKMLEVLYSYKAEFIQSLLSMGKKQLASRLNLTYRFIDDVLSINNPELEIYLGQMYSIKLEIKDTIDSITSASYLDLLPSIGRGGQLHTSIYDKRNDSNFHITNFPFMSSNIQSLPAYGVFVSQPIRYARACSLYDFF